MDSTRQTEATGVAVDGERFRLRRFLESLQGTDELQIVDDPVDLADVARILEDNARAVWFKQVGPERAELAGNVTASRGRLAAALGVTPDKLLPAMMSRLASRPQMVEVARETAPVQQVVLTGADADFTKLPANLQHGFDGGPYISASIDFAKDQRTGFTNVGVRRLMLRGRQEAGVDLMSPSDLRMIYQASVARGERLPVSFVVGCHPLDCIAATMRLPIDELGIVGSLRNAPTPVVKCVTNGIMVPADAEYVLEGYVDEKGYVEPEGPYGEFLGYYGGVKHNPVFHLTAITHRRDPLFQTMTISGKSMGATDTAMLSALRTEVMIWRALEGAVRQPLAVYATGSSGGMFNVRIALRQIVPGEARNAIAAAFGSLANVKNVFVVDPDIDIFSDQQIDWALATRFQANRDLVVDDGFRALPLDPSLAGGRIGAKAGFDLTWPFGMEDKLERHVPAPPEHKGKRFDSVEAALADGPKFFEELMDAIGSRDGREVVVMLEGWRGGGRLSRDERGRYRLDGDR
ncbi:MAG TPA: UbiD family decarboxylase [Stellaceae bacterium]|jgi:UbiD family decarboxylase|nr:UbiD family decarboxylase [Stellaceae bacterium]